MRRLRKWLLDVFLPTWAKECVVTENEKLRAENEKLRNEIKSLNSYIDGLQDGIRSQRKIVVNTGGRGEK